MACACGKKKAIADLPEDCRYSQHEVDVRNKLACMYHLFERFGWSEGIYTHTSARINESEFLLNPYGANFFEITASNLVKLTLDGVVVDTGSLDKGVNDAGYNLHSAIFKAQPHVGCIIHLHPFDIVAVSAMKCGLLPVSQDGMSLGPISYHEYQGLVNDPAEQDPLIKDWLPNSKIMILKNHGILVAGATIEEAFFYMYWAAHACTIQVKAMRGGLENLIIPNQATQDKYMKEFLLGAEGIRRGGPPPTRSGFGELDWDAWMRVLENEGCKTGQKTTF